MSGTVAVIGSNSFSGSHFSALLLEAGYRVTGISRSPEPDPLFLPPRLGDRKGFVFHRLDLNRDLDAVMAVLKRARPRHVVNFAAQGMVRESWETPGDWFRTNTLSQVLLHDRLRRLDFLEKYLHVSTPEVYGPTAEKKTEDWNYRPSTPYAVSRAAADMSLASFFQAYSFPVVFTRAANVYGPGQRPYRLIPRVALAALTGGRMTLNNGGASRRSFIQIEDAMRATMAVMEKGRPGEIYHIATERLTSIREIAEMTAKTAGAELAELADNGPGRPGRDAVYNLDSSKIRRELGWSDKVELADGIRETVAWVRDNLAALEAQPLEYRHKA
ncbi:MAG: GDP-mannose 4,6-dehydratase [Planctomycetota bacterium]|jgi:dTDP-glucose 4,6-dehydratase|nr:GDP-mannose 4,6-dehydratase [Planctomycetota bacterium]